MIRQITLGSIDTTVLRKQSGHKFNHGHAMVFSGGAGRTGAARLAARAALRVGAGLVTLAVPPSAKMEVSAQISALMVRSVASSEAAAEVVRDARINALCIGPGFGMRDDQLAHVRAVLEAGRPTVLDADALSLLAPAQNTSQLLHPECVLTPHGGEFARLFPQLADGLDAKDVEVKARATSRAAEQCGCVVLFKGEHTVIAHPDGRSALHSAVGDLAAPWLATAGSGDVLSGLITGLLARGLEPMHAAEMATCLHAECARSFGPGLIAEDLPEEVPRVFRRLGV